jgi:hypothetical protein
MTRKEARLIRRRKNNRPSELDLALELSRLLGIEFKLKATEFAHVPQLHLEHFSGAPPAKV